MQRKFLIHMMMNSSKCFTIFLFFFFTSAFHQNGSICFDFVEIDRFRQSKCLACQYLNRSMHQLQRGTPFRCQEAYHHKMAMQPVCCEIVFLVFFVVVSALFILFRIQVVS